MEIRYLFSRKHIPHILAGLTFCFMLFFSEYLFHLYFQNQRGMQKSEIFSKASALRLHIEREINTTLNLSTGLMLFVSTNPDFPAGQFAAIARELRSKAPYLRNIALARNNVITHVYPLKGNEKALGVQYSDLPEQWNSVQRAIKLKNTVIAGPVNLKQGGRGFISRIPIFLPREEGRYWGLASIVINIEEFYKACGLSENDPQVRYALRGRDGLGEKGEVFFGSPSLFTDEDAIILPISLPSGEWILAANPVAELTVASSPRLIILRTFGIAVSLAVSALVYGLLSSYRRIQYLALHDPLTELANRRLFFEHVKQAISTAVRTNTKFTIFYLDLDNFKPINDSHGHKHGDHVLKEVAQRMSHGLRHSDITARIGGDEFILLMQDTKTSEKTMNLLRKIEQIVCQPFTLDNGVTVEIQASIGASIFPDDGTTADELIRCADRKMYSIKSAKKA